jgi:hypothetical protein
MVTPNAPDRSLDEAAELAMATVLRAEREAREHTQRVRAEAGHMAEEARASARRVAERTETRIRSIVAAFEHELGQRLAAIDSQAAALTQAHELGAEELAALQHAVAALARELTGGPA